MIQDIMTSLRQSQWLFDYFIISHVNIWDLLKFKIQQKQWLLIVSMLQLREMPSLI